LQTSKIAKAEPDAAQSQAEANTQAQKIELSVIIPITERRDPVTALFHEYRRGIDATGLTYELICVVDGDQPDALRELTALQETEDFRLIPLSRWYGETTALNAAFSAAAGDILLTLPAYQQIEADEIVKMVNAIKTCDMVLCRRWPRIDSFLNRLQTRLFNALLRRSTDLKIQDIGCGVRMFKRRVIDEVQIYGDLHRFLPLLAHRQGFRIVELDVAQAAKDAHQHIYPPGVYIRRLLDLLSIFFLIKFTKKPLRFFGLVGTALASLGGLSTLYLIVQRLFFDVALADRPVLVLCSLLIVLGLQIIAIGLIGELIIFTHAKELKEYKIDEIVN